MMLPQIQVVPGRLPYVCDDAMRVLRDGYRDFGVFECGARFVRVAPAGAPDQKKGKATIARSPESIVLRSLTVPMVRDTLGRAAHFVNQKLGDIDCPPDVAATILSRAGQGHLLRLAGVVNAPILCDEGRILLDEGYDEATGLYLYSPGVAWCAPKVRTIGAAQAAATTLLSPFAEFNVTPEGKAVIIGAILTGLQRRRLFSAPAFAFDAPKQGSGKSLLADCISIVATGHEATSTSVNSDPEELRKKLLSVLLDGDAIVALDNITASLRSDALATILTQPTYKDRILGISKSETVPTNALFVLTGNNLTFSGDMPSRVLVARIEPDCERPEERTFRISDLRRYMKDHRIELVEAALTILASYAVAGRPSQNLKPFGRFDQWSDEIRGAIVWAGLPDPCATRDAIEASDPERESKLALFTAWSAAFGENQVTLSRLIAAAVGDAADADLRAALLNVAADWEHPDQISAYRLAAWVRARKGQVVDRLTLKDGDTATHGGFKTYRIVKIKQIVEEEA